MRAASASAASQLPFGPRPVPARLGSPLGDWTGPNPITFGNNGRPSYFAGPRDDSARILATLRRTVGESNFEYSVIG